MGGPRPHRVHKGVVNDAPGGLFPGCDARERICRPLHMDNTYAKPPPGLKWRMAVGHDDYGKRAPDFNLQVMAPAGALRSTVNDLLKYLAAETGLTNSALSPLMLQSQVIRHTDSPDFGKTAMPWVDQNVFNPPGTDLLGHGGGTLASTAFIGFDRLHSQGCSDRRVSTDAVYGYPSLQYGQLAHTCSPKLALLR